MLAVGLVAASVAVDAQAVTVFAENFEGFTSFPVLKNTFTVPLGGLPFPGTVEERVNPGVPGISEGAQGVWYGVRFASGTKSISNAVGVQNYGSINRPDDPNANYTHVGRFEDDAGLVFKTSTAGLKDVHLAFDWRTYDVTSTDHVRVGYRFTNPGFGACTGDGGAACQGTFTSGGGSFGNWTELTLSDPSPKGNSNVWVDEDFLLAAFENKSEVWVAFWMDNGAGDIGKIDNILVTGTSITPVPLPAALPLFGAGLGLLGWVGRRRR
jgi:hypothetical protein